MEILRYILGLIFLLIGMVMFFIEIFGVFHFKYALNRMHSAAMGDTLGISASMLGLMIFSGFNYTTLKMGMVIMFLWCASPVASHLLAKLELTTFCDLKKHAEIYPSLEALEDELARDRVYNAEKYAAEIKGEQLW